MKERLSDKGTLTTKCIRCGTIFSMTKEEIDWYRRKGHSLPKKCAVCRRLERIAISRDGHDKTYVVRREEE